MQSKSCRCGGFSCIALALRTGARLQDPTLLAMLQVPEARTSSLLAGEIDNDNAVKCRCKKAGSTWLASRERRRNIIAKQQHGHMQTNSTHTHILWPHFAFSLGLELTDPVQNDDYFHSYEQERGCTGPVHFGGAGLTDGPKRAPRTATPAHYIIILDFLTRLARRLVSFASPCSEPTRPESCFASPFCFPNNAHRQARRDGAQNGGP